MSKSTAVQSINTQAVVGGFSQSELDTLKSTIAKGTSNEQFALFVQTCARSGLNPFLNQIYCIVYNGKNGPVMSIQIAVEGIVALAKKHPQYKGFIAAEIRQNDHFKAKIHTGEVEHEPDVMNPGETIGAYCIAYRENAPNVLVIVRRDQVEHLLKGRNGDMWRDYFDDMIVKHAIKRAFKRQFGIEVSEDEHVEPNSLENTPSYEPPARRDITAEVVESTPPPNQQEAPSGEEQQVREKIKEAFKALGIKGKQAQAEYMRSRMNQKGDKPTLQELTGLLKIMELEIEEQQDIAGIADGLGPLE
ncbi:RecT protein [Paenibacillus dendritiformis]|uniref:RecT family recombinase n=1 Tax=Paenibacillus dendritiformis TaxID=130049 RepID=UPI00105A005E|nr:RecT family recombinase [Paenibacillus dendritiformis]TDL50925.1 RecT protein [Paenibacillus dendritiformis]